MSSRTIIDQALRACSKTDNENLTRNFNKKFIKAIHEFEGLTDYERKYSKLARELLRNDNAKNRLTTLLIKHKLAKQRF